MRKPADARHELVGRVATIAEFATRRCAKCDRFPSRTTIHQIAQQAGASSDAVEWALREAVQRGELRRCADHYAAGGGVSSK